MDRSNGEMTMNKDEVLAIFQRHGFGAAAVIGEVTAGAPALEVL